jgi:2-oxoisovalerate ferredoxin oxidoreductase delta subunit
MTDENKDQNKPYPLLNIIECKGCGRCVIACPKNVLLMSDDLNARGYHYVMYAGNGCSGCTNCYYTCPEPRAIEIHIPGKKGDL